MRAVLSILGLVVAFAIVMFVMKKQAGQLLPHKPPAAAGASAPPANAPDAVRQQLRQSMEQGAARASEALP
ncbi:MAG: hypothetical protein ABW005_14060 [Burkholderiaceae bacterium]